MNMDRETMQAHLILHGWWPAMGMSHPGINSKDRGFLYWGQESQKVSRNVTNKIGGTRAEIPWSYITDEMFSLFVEFMEKENLL